MQRGQPRCRVWSSSTDLVLMVRMALQVFHFQSLYFYRHRCIYIYSTPVQIPLLPVLFTTTATTSIFFF